MRTKRFLLQSMLVLAAIGASAVGLQTPALATGTNAGTYYWWSFANNDTAQNSDAKCIDVPRGNAADNLPVQTYQCHTAANQRWTQWRTDVHLQVKDPTDPTHTRNTSRYAYWFQNASNECLTVKNNGMNNNDPVILFNCASNQPNNFNAQWATIPVPDMQNYWENGLNYFWIVNVNSGKCLTVQNPAGHAGAGWLIQYDCNEGQNEVWTSSTSSPA